MPELQVRGELYALSRGDVAVGDEDHVGDGAAGEDDAADELADQIEGGVLIRDCHNDADGNVEEGSYGQSEEEAVPRKMDFGIAMYVIRRMTLGDRKDGTEVIGRG